MKYKKSHIHLLFETLIFNLLGFFNLSLCKLLLQQIAYWTNITSEKTLAASCNKRTIIPVQKK